MDIERLKWLANRKWRGYAANGRAVQPNRNGLSQLKRLGVSLRRKRT